MTSRDEARAQGLVRYFSGEPCSSGHLSERYTKNGRCVRCNADAMARWAKRNPEKAKAQSARTYAKRRSDIIARSKVWAEANPDRRRAISLKWATANRDVIAFNRMSARSRHWSCENTLTLDELRQIRASSTECKYCGSTDRLSYDHIVALSKCGPNAKHNIQILCLPCNCAKNDRDEAEFLAGR